MTGLELLLFAILAILPSACAVLLVTPLVLRTALSQDLIDKPSERKVHQSQTPMGGGVAIWIGIVSTFAAATIGLWVIQTYPDLAARALPTWAAPHVAGAWAQQGKLWGLLLAATLLMILGLVDDKRGLPWTWRLGLQFVIAGAMVTWQDWRLTAFIDWPPITWGLSVLWIVALINAFNMLDNMDGLSAGVAAIASSVLAANMLLGHDPQTGQPQLFVAGLLLVLSGALLGFLWHNRPPAKIFMGDAGSYLIGFTVAVGTMLATYTGYEAGRPHAILAPVCVLAVPFFDMLTVIWIRIKQGRSPFHADKNHLSHRLVVLGFTKGQAVAVIYLLTLTTGLAALLLPRLDLVGALITLCLVVSVMVLIGLLESTGRRQKNDKSP